MSFYVEHKCGKRFCRFWTYVILKNNFLGEKINDNIREQMVLTVKSVYLVAWQRGLISPKQPNQIEELLNLIVDHLISANRSL